MAIMRPLQRNILRVFGLCLSLAATAAAEPTMTVVAYRTQADYWPDRPGLEYIFTITVTNTSDIGAHNNMIEFTYPSGDWCGPVFLECGDDPDAAEGVFWIFSDWAYSEVNGATVFTGILEPGQQHQHTIYTTLPDLGYRPATATARGPPPEPFNPVAVLVPVIPIWGDEDRDGDVDADDYGEFEACASGPAVPYDPAATTTHGNLCSMFDADDDGDIDQSDFGRWEVCYSGEGNMSDCETESPYPPEPQ